MPAACRNRAVVASCSLVSALLAQQAPVWPSPERIAIGVATASLVEQEGDLWGVGTAYKARFDVDGMEFVPAFGPAAPRNFPVRYELAAIGRGEGLVAVAVGERRHDELRVEYVRSQLVERYDVRPDGVEQSFVLSVLPPGRGDLVVRGRLSTGLQVAPHAGGLQFTLPGVGSCTLGGVTGFDAAGNRANGTVSYHDGVVDYTLPEAFVATAQLPLIVDPFLGNNITVAGGSSFDQDPDVAYDMTNQVWLVVYELVFSATDTDIYAQRVGVNGTLVGTRIDINSSAQDDVDPQVCNINLRDRFVVVYNRRFSGQGDVLATTVDAATGATSSSVLTVAGGADSQGFADVSGEATTADQDAICVWQNATQNVIEAAQIAVDANDNVFVQDVTPIANGRTRPRIDKSGGASGRHMIVFLREFSATDFDPYGVLVDRELTVLGSEVAFDSAVNFTDEVDVDGDGTNWVAAWKVRESSGSTHDCRSNTLMLGSAIVPVATNAGEDETQPGVCWLGDSSIVAFTRSVSVGIGHTYVQPIDAFSCAACEPSVRLVASLTGDFAIAGASRRSGGEAVDGALFAVESRPSTDSNIVASRWESNDGNGVIVQAGCGDQGGRTYASCARSGHSGFAVRCLGAAVSTSAILVGSRAAAWLPCGPCRFVPDPYAGFLHLTNTDSAGKAAFSVALPANAGIVGLDYYLQWVVVEPITPGCYLFGSDLSDALRVTIE